MSRRFSFERLNSFCDSRFEMVVYLSHRAKEIGAGAKVFYDFGKDDKSLQGKPVLVAYEEISRGLLSKADVHESVSKGLKTESEDVDSAFRSSKFYCDGDRQRKIEEKMRSSAEAVFYGDDVDDSSDDRESLSSDDEAATGGEEVAGGSDDS